MWEACGRLLRLIVLYSLSLNSFWGKYFLNIKNWYISSFPFNLSKSTNVVHLLIFASVSIFLRNKLHVRYLGSLFKFSKIKDYNIWHIIRFMEFSQSLPSRALQIFWNQIWRHKFPPWYHFQKWLVWSHRLELLVQLSFQ